MKIKRLIFFGLLISTGALNAQTDFSPGYVIINSGDTLYGKIDYRGDLLMSNSCKLKTDENIVKEFSPKDILSYRFFDGKYYVSRKIDGKSVFLEYLIKGKVNIYYVRDAKGDYYFLDKEGVKMTEIPYDEGIKYVDNKHVFYESTKHIGFLNYYMQDAPEFQKRIKSIKKPEHQNLIKLAEDYHNAVCKGEKCIIYEKKQPFMKVNFEFVGGVVNFENVQDLNDKFYFQSGILAHFWLPRTNEKLFFRTGLQYSVIETDKNKNSIYKFPIQIEYIYPKSKIRPKIAYGINLYESFYPTVALMGGINVKLHESSYWSINYDIDFVPNEKFALIPYKQFSYSILTGIYIKL